MGQCMRPVGRLINRAAIHLDPRAGRWPARGRKSERGVKMKRYLFPVSLLLIGLMGWLAFGAEPVLIAPKWDSPSTPANGETSASAITPDGRFVLFRSDATDLVPVDTNGSVTDMFLYDRIAGTVEMIVPSADGTQPTAGCYSTAISADARYVAFSATAEDLLPGLAGTLWRSYVYDRESDQLELVSIADDGTPNNALSSQVQLSSDGRYACFVCQADNLVPGDTNGVADVFVRDRQVGHTERASVAADGSQLSGLSGYPRISPDGRYVTFTSKVGQGGADEDYWAVFIRDRAAHTTSQVNLSAADAPPALEPSSSPAPISGDGRFVAFLGAADTFVGSDTNGVPDVFLRDRVAGITDLVSYDTNGEQFPIATYPIDISADGRFVVMYQLGQPTARDPWAEYAYVRDRTAGLTLVPGTGGTPGPMSVNGRFVTLSKHERADSLYHSLYLWEPELVEYGTVAGMVTDIDSGAPIRHARVWIGGCLLAITGDDGTYWMEVAVTPDTSVGAEADDYASATETGVAVTAGETTTVNLLLPWQAFPDVEPGSWAASSVQACVEAGIVSGYEDGTYKPTLPVTRDQMAVYISRALAGGDSDVPDFTATPTFPDVGATHWALRHIEYAVAQGVVAGYDDGNYHPEYEVTRDQMAVYVARALVAPSGEAGLADYVPADPRNFPDVPDTFWAYKHIEYCVEHDVVNGYEDGYYYPDIVVTRDQMAVYVARAFGL